MSQEAPPKKRRGLRRFMYVVLGVFVAGLAAVYFTQGMLVEWVASRAVGGTVRVEGLRTWGSIRAERVEIAGNRPGGGTLPAVAVVEGLRIDYRFPGFSDRLLEEVAADSMLINLDAPSEELSNFVFLTEAPSEPRTTPIDPRWLPERVRVARLDVTTALNESRGTVRGLVLSGEFPGGDSALLVVEGQDTTMTFSGVVEGLQPKAVGGAILFSAQVDGQSAALTANALLERTGDFNASASVRLNRSWLEPEVGLEALDATLNSASLDGTVFADFINGLTGDSLAFVTAIAEPTRIRFDFAQDAGLPEIRGGVLVQGLRLGSSDAPFYRGDLALAADVPGGASNGSFQLALDESHIITAAVAGAREAGTATIFGEGWEKDKLIALLPVESHAVVRQLVFSRADLHADIGWAPEGVAAGGRVVPSGRSGAVASFAANLPKQDNWTAEGYLAVGSGTVNTDYAGRGLEQFDLTTTFENLQVLDALRLAAGDSGDLDVAGTITGHATAQARPDSEFITYEGAATLTAPSFEPIAFETIAAEFQGRLPREADRAELSHVTLDTGDGTTRANFADVVVNFDPFYVRSQLAAGLDLAHVARWYDLPDLYGEAEISGPVGYANDMIGFPLTVRIPTLGYGNTVLPYRTVIHTEITVDYDVARQRGELEGFEMHIGDGTRLVISQGKFTFNPFVFTRTYFDMESDLKLAAGMGMFDSVEGYARLNGFFGIDNDALYSEWELGADIGYLVFPEAIAAGEGLSLRGAGTYGGAVQGTATLNAERMTIAGGHLIGLSGDAHIADNVVTFPDLRGEMFNGTFAGKVSVDLIEPGLPATVSGRLMAFDLARFTNEVQPPGTRLTGIADATFSVRNTLNGAEDISVQAYSTEGFSMNRDMVRQILESEALSGALGIAQLEKTVNKFLGSAPQRPFNSAELRLNDEGSRLRGVAILLSEKTPDYNGLNLTIELAIDDQALLQTLQMLEESEIANVQF